jgi:uncharacterized protein (TIGR03437 family)
MFAKVAKIESEDFVRSLARVGLLWVASGAVVAWAQTTTSINLNLKGNSATFNWENALALAQTGSVGTLGYASLVFTGSSGAFSDNTNSSFGGPTQITAELAFNETDTIAISFTYPNGGDFGTIAALNFSGGTITGGTGAYAGASGSLNLTIVKDDAAALWTTTTTTGSGSVIAGGNTIPLTLTKFRGWCCGWSTRERNYSLFPVSVSGSLGNPSGQVKLYFYPNAPTAVDGLVTITFNGTDSLIMGYGYTPSVSEPLAPPSSFTGNIVGGTGKYTNAYGALNYTNVSGGLNVTGTMTLPSSGATITHVKTVYGSPWMATNTWLEIHGTNLVPADTPSAGVDWSNAPEFANGQMPTQLGPVSVTFGGGGSLGYVYFYCSAQTNPNCADDQINVLAPLLGMGDSFLMKLAVNNNGTPIAVTAPLRDAFSPAFLSLDSAGHIAARHLDASLVGPTSLYPGSTTPAKAGETISLYGVGFGAVSMVMAGSATQSGSFTIPAGYCWVSGISVQAVPGALVSPGLYQLNLTIPQGVPSGDNPVECIQNFYPTFPGAIIAIQ